MQGELEKAADRLFVGRSRMVGASRTDAGAHATGQVAHFDVDGRRDSLETDLLMMNSFLPADVKVVGLEYAPPGFDSHFSARGKVRASCVTERASGSIMCTANCLRYARQVPADPFDVGASRWRGVLF